MSFYYGNDKIVRVMNYGKSYRNIDEVVHSGVISIRHNNGDNIRAVVDNSEVTECRIIRKGRLVFAEKFGEFQKSMSNGKVTAIHRYRKGTARGYHGLTTRSDVSLFGYKGKCHSFFSRGRLLWQKYTYPNGRTAYYVRATDTLVEGVHPNGVKMFKIEVSHLYLKGRQGMPFFNQNIYGRNQYDFSTDGILSKYVFFDRRGRVQYQGMLENKQQVGKVIRNYKQYFFLSGLEVPKKLYDAKPEDIKASVVLKIPNAQVRAMFLKKIGYERVIKECEGKVIDTDGNYALIDFPVKYSKDEHDPDKTLRILKVVCPSTKGNYFLKIPPTDDFKTCKRARNGTFTGFDPQAKEVQFAVET